MIEFARHIEVLLLDNDCVIIPGFGGFVSHRNSSLRIENERLFLPPSRTVGFNSSMKLNDGLLVQSFMIAYDTSYPDAVRIVEKKVSILENILHEEGECELHGIGTLRENIQGQYTFSPLESGILSPSLYGLSSFEMSTLNQIAQEEKKQKAQEAASHKPEVIFEPKFIHQEEREISPRARKTQRIINWVAAAVAIIFISLLAVPFTHMGHEQSNEAQELSETVSDDSRSLVAKAIDAISMKQSNPSAELINHLDTAVKAIPSKPVVKEETVQEKPSSPTHYFTIVLASQVNRKNAEIFISRLHKKGLSEVQLLEKKFVSVVFGKFENQSEAYNKINELRADYSEFKQAWVKEIK